MRTDRRQCGWLAAVVVGLTFSVVWAGSAGPSPEKLSIACIAEMNEFHDVGIARMTTEYLAFASAMNALAAETPVPKAFKLFSNECRKLDSIERSTASKIQKAAAKCLAKLQRLGAEQSFLDDVEASRDQLTENLASELRQTYQFEAAERLSEFVQAN